MEERIVRIEEKIAHNEHFTGELDEAVQELQREVKQLRALITRMEKRLQEHVTAPDDVVNLADEKPPHY